MGKDSFFDTIVDHRYDSSARYANQPTEIRSSVISLTVADMDFGIPVFLSKALKERSSLANLGYYFADQSDLEATAHWLNRFGAWVKNTSWIVYSQSASFSLSCLIQAFSKPNDGVLILSPSYYPFMNITEGLNRKVLLSELNSTDGDYTIDLTDFAKKAKSAKIFLLCNPHNPTGRSWSKEELQSVFDICQKNHLLIISDEVHADLTLTGSHVYAATVTDYAMGYTASIFSASKAFNLSGLKTSYVVIKNSQLRSDFKEKTSILGGSLPNVLGLTATVTAYRYGRDWLSKLQTHLKKNHSLVSKTFNEIVNNPISKVPDATYFAWINCNSITSDDISFTNKLYQQEKLQIYAGSTFGPGGKGYVRINLATSRSTLEEALARIKRHLNKIK